MTTAQVVALIALLFQVTAMIYVVPLSRKLTGSKFSGIFLCIAFALMAALRLSLFMEDSNFMLDTPGSAKEETFALLSSMLLLAGMIYVDRLFSVRQGVEEELRRTQERFTQFTDHNPALAWIKDEGGRYVYINKPFEREFQTTLEKIKGKRDEDLWLEGIAKDIRESDRRILETNKPEELYRTAPTPDGVLHHWWVLKFPLSQEKGKRLFGGMALDITKTKLAEDEMRKAISLLTTTFDSTDNGFLIVNRKGEVMSCNRKFANLWRIPETVLASRDDEQMIRFVLEQLENPQGFVERIEALKQSPESQSFDEIRFKDGRVFERYSQPHRLEDEIVGRVWSFRDVTERKRAEEALRDSEMRFRSIWENSADGMRLTDKAGIIVAANQSYCRMVEMDAKQLEGRPVSVIYSADDRRVMEEYRKRFDTRNVDGKFERKVTFANGKTMDLEVSNSFVELENQSPLLLGIFRDITDRRQAEEQRIILERKLLDAQKLESLGVLAGGIAHDFNNLLTAIMGNAGLAMLESAETSPIRQYLSNIEKTSAQAAALCRQMLAYSGRGHFVVASLDLNELVEELTHLLQISINKKISLKLHLNPNLPAVEADVAQMRQVIMNLVINASEAIGDKSGIITVTSGTMHADQKYLAEAHMPDTPRAGEYVYLEISDTGCGMSPETKAKIFDPFFTTKFTGRGLGLAAVMGIVRGHKGSMKVYSELGRGTTFRMLLPCAEGKAQEISRAELDNSSWRGEGTILLVDDEEAVRTVTSNMLRRLGFKVLTARDGQEGVETFHSYAGEIKAVVLDMTMPRLNGEEAFREIKRIRSDAKVLLISGYNELEATTRFAGKGLAGFLQKPFKPDDLKEKIRCILSHKATGFPNNS